MHVYYAAYISEIYAYISLRYVVSIFIYSWDFICNPCYCHIATMELLIWSTVNC